MRLWTIHPKYLDSQGLVALWREALLAKKVLQGKTKGYRNHPQLIRFRQQDAPIKYINRYLETIYEEACRRGYCFDARKFKRVGAIKTINETDGQLLYEWKHLKRKLKARCRKKYLEIRQIEKPKANPIFRIVKGEIKDWEKINAKKQVYKGNFKN